jgi:hypothetical protein
MSTDRDVTRIVRSWLEEGVTALPDRVLDTVLDQLPATPQRRAWWPARRYRDMNSFAKLAVAAAAVVVVAIVGFSVLPRAGGIAGPGPSATPTPTPSPAPSASPVTLLDGELAPGTYVFVPCTAPPCSTSDESIHLTIDVPSGWSGVVPGTVWIDENAAPGGAALGIGFGGNLPRDPCLTTDCRRNHRRQVRERGAATRCSTPRIPSTSASLASPEVIDLRLPADLPCEEFRPWEPGIYAQGPSHQWHLWILDVAGTRVVIGAMDYPATSPQRRAELQAMVESIQIEP